MPLPPVTAELSLYQSSRHYRTVPQASSADDVVHLADACVDECIQDCLAVANGGDVPGSLLELECRIPCVHWCRESRLPQCRSGEKLCRRLSTGQPECCPQSDECCTIFDWNGIISSYNICCPPGKSCCHGNGCYVPGERQCSEHALCRMDQTVCGTQCCDPGEKCEPGLGCAPISAVNCGGALCVPPNVCRANKCCPPAAATSSQCCASGVSCQDECCKVGEICTRLGCLPQGEYCNETSPCPPLHYCCDNLKCCREAGPGRPRDECVRSTDPEDPEPMCRTPFH
jgi:hypothetical protein